MRFKITGLLLLLISLPALAKPSAAGKNDYDLMYSTCLRDAGGARNATVAACAERVLGEAEAEITSQYQTLHRGLLKTSTSDAKELEQAQRSWLSYRNSHCKLAGKYVGSPMYAYCPMQLTIQRVKQLRDMAEASSL
jgi:uncharacterized protein YecT (DUF1311 family)